MGILKNIVTLGAMARVEKKRAELEALLSQYQKLSQVATEKQKQVHESLAGVIELKLQGIKELQKAAKLLSRLSMPELATLKAETCNLSASEHFTIVNTMITKALEAEETAKNRSKIQHQRAKHKPSWISSVHSALGQWALFDAVPPVLASFPEAAATSEEPWEQAENGQEKGRLKGVESYMELLRGGFSVPQAVVVNGIISHYRAFQKIREINDEIAEMQEIIGITRHGIQLLNTLDKCAQELNNLLEEGIEEYRRAFKQTYRRIYPMRFLAGITKWGRKLRGKDEFSASDLRNIAYIASLAADLVTVLEKRIHKHI